MATTRTPNLFTVRTMDDNADDALARVNRYLVDGFAATGRTIIWNRYGMIAVEVANNGGDRNDCWVMLTSYGMSPSKDLGSVWEALD